MARTYRLHFTAAGVGEGNFNMRRPPLLNPLAAIVILDILIGAGCQPEGQDQAFIEYEAALKSLPYEAPASDARLPQLTEDSTLSDYLAYASLNNPGLEAAFHKWKAALEDVPQVKALPDPKFEFQYWIREQAMRDGDVRFIYGLSQEVPWLEKLRLRADVAALEAKAAYRRFESERLKLFDAVKESYFEYQYLLRAIQINEQNLQQLTSIEDIIRARYRAATAAQPDVIRAQVELGKLENELASLRDLKGPTAAKLNAALNRPADSPVPMKAGLDSAELTVPDEELVAWMKQSNPDLAAMDLDIARQRTSVELARQDYYPDVMIGFQLMDMFPAAGMRASDMTDPVAAMLAVNIPVWWEKYAAGVRQAQARQHAAVKDKLNAANNLAAEVKVTSYSFRNAGRKVVLYRQTLLPRAAQAMRATLAAYQAGTSSFSDMIDSYRLLLEFQLEQERAMADRLQSLAKLEMLVGRPLSVSRPPASEPATRSSLNHEGQ